MSYDNPVRVVLSASMDLAANTDVQKAISLPRNAAGQYNGGRIVGISITPNLLANTAPDGTTIRFSFGVSPEANQYYDSGIFHPTDKFHDLADSFQGDDGNAVDFPVDTLGFLSKLASDFNGTVGVFTLHIHIDLF